VELEITKKIKIWKIQFASMSSILNKFVKKNQPISI